MFRTTPIRFPVHSLCGRPRFAFFLFLFLLSSPPRAPLLPFPPSSSACSFPRPWCVFPVCNGDAAFPLYEPPRAQPAGASLFPSCGGDRRCIMDATSDEWKKSTMVDRRCVSSRRDVDRTTRRRSFFSCSFHSLLRCSAFFVSLDFSFFSETRLYFVIGDIV